MEETLGLSQQIFFSITATPASTGIRTPPPGGLKPPLGNQVIIGVLPFQPVEVALWPMALLIKLKVKGSPLFSSS